ncbi:MAG: hypothetical protein HZC17_03035 [Candidatus Omnitrophica bacterium]|nr:hypothetical protein [Candidatus Omnitrophota bacterium]
MNKKWIVSLAAVMLISNAAFAQVTEVPINRAPFKIAPVSPEQEIFLEIRMPEPLVVEAKRIRSVTEKLSLLGEALLNGDIRGLSPLKQNGFQKRLLAVAAKELMSWLEESEKDKSFQQLFKGAGPWMMVFIPKSAFSTDDAEEGFDMPGSGPGLLGSRRLPIDVSIRANGENLEIELRGGADISLHLRVNGHDEIVLVN